MPATPALLDDDGCYRALAARDARFDGRFFTGVITTGIYCRPVCRVRTPLRSNCRFFCDAAQAEQAGFRPCLRCRPELAPHYSPWSLPWSLHDASATLAEQAARLLDEPGGWGEQAEGPALPRLAGRLGVRDRHLRRIFEARFGVSPLQYLQTRRLLCAKQLLTDTDLPVADVALASGFASVRRFNTVFCGHYGMPPTRLRKSLPAAARGVATVRLGLRPPYDAQAVMDFLARRAVPGVEQVVGGEYTRTACIPSAQRQHTGWFSVRIDSGAHQAVLLAGDGLRGALPTLIRRVRHLFDLDADPQAIDAVLDGDFPGGDGLRVPGTIDGFELAVRAVLGQQITVAAARTLAGRLAERFGEPLATPHGDLVRLFPTAQALAAAGSDALGRLGRGCQYFCV
ncbi:MAG: putative bifunctional transcriptional activator/DNA repair enzyme AlkA [Herbaspirillum frisingense]|uniref:Putative bifunctional transcriptional activator/DNA repair enzyme AlkA n=1 Tax=Herbaspirillum frisingense TaxID=92645 RepID=A0A7V8JTD5_9BURK|nr:MAG: putative bifunctional transcriptional activator/DNA repair enzyme AlkA [Herbaspirillum frisingense]